MRLLERAGSDIVRYRIGKESSHEEP